PEGFADAPNAFDRHFVAVAARPWPVTIVQGPRPIQAGREQNAVRFAEFQDAVSDERKVRRDYELQFTPFKMVPGLNAFHNVANQFEIQQRFTSLELDFDRRRRTSKHEVDCPFSRFQSHVVGDAIGRLTRYLTIGAAMVASQRDNK